jgi:hypothetical protein
MLDFVEKTFDQMTLLVQMLVIITLLFAIFSGRDDRLGLFLSNFLQKRVRIIGAVGNRPLEPEVCYQIFSLCDVMPLPARQKKAQWIAQGVYTGVDFGAESASATPESLCGLAAAFFWAPAAQGCARTTVLSSRIFSISGSLTKC